MALILATKVSGVVKIISFFFHPKASPARCNAAVPLETTQTYLVLNFFDNFFSNLSTCGPWVNNSDFKTFITASISSSFIVCRPY